MAEETLDVRHLPRAEAWRVLNAQVAAILEGVTDEITAMATMSCVVHHGLGLLWTGFYRVVEPGLLRVGPYQGTLGCLEIRVGRGVCGTSAAERRAVLVPNVAEFPGHITCDGRAASELVLPVFGADGALVAVFDLDAHTLAAFSDADVAGATEMLAWFSGSARGG